MDMYHLAVWHIGQTELFIRIGLSALLGGAVGLERELGEHAAGFRTHILVCIGSALIVLLSIYGFSEFVNEPNVRVDPARMAAQVVSGIGFLGAGTIMRTKASISGLTTAASLWVVAAIGLAVGAGFYKGALFCTVVVLISLFVLNKLENLFFKPRKKQEVIVEILQDHPHAREEIMEMIKSGGFELMDLQMEHAIKKMASGSMDVISIKLTIKSRPRNYEELVQNFIAMNCVIGVADSISS